VTRIGRLIDTATTRTTARDRRARRAIVRLPAKGYGTTEFDMSEARRNALVGRRRAMQNWLAPPRACSRSARTPRHGGARRATVHAVAIDLLE